MKKANNPTLSKSRLSELTEDLNLLESRLRFGGGPEKITRQHEQGKLTARERIDLLLDEDSYYQEIGLLVAYDQYEGAAPSAGVVTGVGIVHGREVVVVANDATVKAGSWWPETIKKILRAQEIAMRSRVQIIYLVDSGGVNLPYQGGVFPGQYGAARIFYYNSIMRRYLKVPQIANETLGGAMTHNAISGVAHYRTKDDGECLEKIRELVSELPAKEPTRVSITECRSPRVSKGGTSDGEHPLYSLLPE